ncbi:MAG: hypothetical protein ACREEP_10330 [Dongiaceae bacterium]
MSPLWLARHVAPRTSAVMPAHSKALPVPISCNPFAVRLRTYYGIKKETSMPTPPYTHPLNLLMQTVFTVTLWSLAAVLIVIAIRRSLRERSWFPILLVASVAFGSLIEPLYDIAYHLLWFIPGQWTLFTSFDLPQPVWVMSAYIVVFAGPALFLLPAMERGVTLPRLFRLAGITAVTTAVFEIAAIQCGTYMYYGSHPFRLFGYPLWIAFAEAAQIACFTIAALELRRRVRSEVGLLGLFVLFPANFCFTTLGAGFPGLIAINMVEPPLLFLSVAAALSTLFFVGSLWLVASVSSCVHTAGAQVALGRDSIAESAPGYQAA